VSIVRYEGGLCLLRLSGIEKYARVPTGAGKDETLDHSANENGKNHERAYSSHWISMCGCKTLDLKSCNTVNRVFNPGHLYCILYS
jgi:hypothetical protein